MAKRTITRITGKGNKEVLPMPADLAAKLNATHQNIAQRELAEELGENAEDLSPARRRLLRLQRPVAKRIHVFNHNGEDWYIRALTFAENTRLGMLTPRDKDGLLNMANPDEITALVAAMLYVCVAADEHDSANFFEWKDAVEMANATDDATLADVDFLFNAIREVNKTILPGVEAKTVEEAAEQEKKDVSAPSGQPGSATSSTLPTEEAGTGSNNTASIEEPVTLQGDTSDDVDSKSTLPEMKRSSPGCQSTGNF